MKQLGPFPLKIVGALLHAAALEEAFVRRVLLDVGGFPLFGGVGMMFVLHRLIF